MPSSLVLAKLKDDSKRTVIITPVKMAKAVAAYQAGASVADVARSLRVAVATARNLLVQNGVTIRGRGRPRKAAASK